LNELIDRVRYGPGARIGHSAVPSAVTEQADVDGDLVLIADYSVPDFRDWDLSDALALQGWRAARSCAIPKPTSTDIASPLLTMSTDDSVSKAAMTG